MTSFFQIILVSSQAPPPEEQHEIKGTFTTVSVPPDLGAWAICSDGPTRTISNVSLIIISFYL